MKPLNRPMFRYGGPIKEGIMSGIKESRQGYANGPGLVIPNDPNKMGVARALKNAEAFMNVGKTYNQNLNNQAAVLPVNNEMDLATIGGYGKIEGPSIEYDKIPKYIADIDGDGIRDINPEYTKNKSFINDIFGGPFVRRTNKKSVPQIKTGVGGRQFTGMEEQIVGDPRKNLPDSSKKGGGVELSAEERRAKNVERYRDIMDIKGMNKDAAYNSLIAASQAINQSGDFKGDIKSGKLINQIIQATSKQFDKPKQTKDAIDTLILKGEIEKDIKASDPTTQQRARLTEKQIALADKQLAGDSLQEVVTASYVKNGVYPSGSNLAGLARTRGIDVKDVAKLEDVNNFLKANPGKNAVDFIEAQVQITIEQGKPITPGAYVVKDRIIVIDSEGNVSPYL